MGRDIREETLAKAKNVMRRSAFQRAAFQSPGLPIKPFRDDNPAALFVIPELLFLPKPKKGPVDSAGPFQCVWGNRRPVYFPFGPGPL